MIVNFRVQLEKLNDIALTDDEFKLILKSVSDIYGELKLAELFEEQNDAEKKMKKPLTLTGDS